jgi:N-acetylmuramoyl-L-alanine amidase
LNFEEKNKIFCGRWLVVVLLVFFSVISVARPSQVKLTALRVSSVGKNTRLIFSLKGPFKYHRFTLSKPNRLIVDFNNVSSSLAVKQIKLGHSAIKAIRTGIQSKNKLRVVFELKKSLNPKSYTLRPRGKLGYRLVVDLLPAKEKHKFIEKLSKRKVTQKKKAPIKEDELRDIVVVIDPGHGGKDPGATGSRGTHEKNVVLAISKDLYSLLQKQNGIKAKLTRRGDYFVPLRGRLRLARKGSTDLFIAIHADAYKDRYARGASVFALSQRGATSELARWLAQKENYSELMGGVDLDDKSYLLRSVLIDLSQTATIRESLQQGKYIMQALGKTAKLHRRHVEQAPFVVLKSPDIPSILIEVGFISNRQEELLLRGSKYQHKIANALMKGIVGYLHRYPPPGTMLAALRKGSFQHVVHRGENLTIIAKRYGANVLALKKLNHLHGSEISIGQIIQVPKKS